MALEHMDLPLPMVKRWIGVDHNADDDIILLLIEAGKSQARAYLNHNFTRINAGGVVDFLAIPSDVKIATLKIINSLWLQRDDVRTSENLGGVSYSLGQVPRDAQQLLNQYRRNPGL